MRGDAAQRVITAVLLVGLFFGLVTLVSGMSSWRLPDRETGYSPVQPIAFSHRLHAGELQLECRFCHVAADQSRHAGIPSTDVCMKCHHVVSCSFDVLQQERTRAADQGREPAIVVSDDLRPLYRYLGLDEDLQLVSGRSAESIPWIRVHNLPDFVVFDHSAHVAAGVTCQRCHGPIESMERVRQHADLSMGWCVDCHRETTEEGVGGRPVNASTNCTVCHY